VLKSLTQRSKCVAAESRCLRLFKECLVLCSMRLGVPFISPRQLGVVGDLIGRQFLPSVEWCTGQSGAPPDMNSSCLVHYLLPFLVKPTFGSLVPLAHRTVRCDHPIVGSATCRPLITQTTVGRGRRLAHRTVRCTPDCPVNYSRGAFAFSREQRVRRRASLGTGQSGAPQAGTDFVEHSQFFSTSFPLFLEMSLILR
jgi:hypothetical protein